jgi:hypothetical protein
VFCAWGIIQLFYVVFCVVRTVHKFGFRHVINETCSKLRPAERRSVSDADLGF